MRRLSLILLGSCLVFSSCFHGGNETGDCISYVSTILQDTSSVGYHVLHSHDVSDKYRSIAVVGSQEEALPVIQEMLTADYHNNIDGHRRPDGLPDFSGEMISGFLDVANSPYQGYVDQDNVDFLREVNVRNFISAIDTSYLYSPYDKNQIEHKSGAKAVILASSYASRYGSADIDTLCQLSGVDVPLFSPVESVLDLVMEHHKTSHHLCIWTTEDKVAARIYPVCYERYRRGRAQPGPDLLIYHPDTTQTTAGRFFDILDLYLESDIHERISCMVVDDPEVDVRALQQLVDDLLAEGDESKLAYRNLIAPDFEFISPARAIAEKVFLHLRETNRFTHKISYPIFRGFLTCPVKDLPVDCYAEDGSFTDEFKFRRAEGTDAVTWYMISMRDRYISDELHSQIVRLAPKIINEYVHQ